MERNEWMAARELPLSVRDLTISPAELRATLGYGTAEPGPDVQEIVDRLTAGPWRSADPGWVSGSSRDVSSGSG